MDDSSLRLLKEEESGREDERNEQRVPWWTCLMKMMVSREAQFTKWHAPLPGGSARNEKNRHLFVCDTFQTLPKIRRPENVPCVMSQGALV